MKSVNILKLLEEQQKDSDKKRLNTTEEQQKRDKIHKYIDTYVVPTLKSFTIDDNYFSEIISKLLPELINQAFEIIVALDNLTIDDKGILQNQDIGFLNSTDTKIKKSIGNRLAEYFMRKYTFVKRKTEYIEEYITPMLEKLNKENIIVYNPKEIDNKSKIANKKLDKLVNKIVDDFTYCTIHSVLLNVYYNAEYVELYDFLFSDNIQAKKDFANDMEEYFRLSIDTIDFKNIDNIDFSEVKKS